MATVASVVIVAGAAAGVVAALVTRSAEPVTVVAATESATAGAPTGDPSATSSAGESSAPTPAATIPTTVPTTVSTTVPTTGMPRGTGGATASASATGPGGASAPGAGSGTGSGSLRGGFDALVATLPVQSARSVGVVIAPIGASEPPIVLGSWTAGPAWSTMKVPLSEAALRQDPGVLATVRSALTVSDNAAAESLWATLGSGTTAAAKVDAVLAAHGDSATRTQAVRVRPPYTPFGQTTWALVDQVRFAQDIACSPQSQTVVSIMGQVTSSQRWGLGSLPLANFKGGWGPDASGRYLVRQFGIVTIGGKRVAVAVAVEPRDGSFGSGTAALSSIARWLGSQDLPGPGHC